MGYFAALCTSCTTLPRKPLTPAARVDLQRYMGPWRVIACMDNKLERDFVDAVETYTLKGDSRVDVHFAWREKSFDAPVKTHDFSGRVRSDGSNARWKMRLFPLFSASYVILHIAPDYSRVAIAHPSRKFGWVLARERTLPENQYQELMEVFKRAGYDTSKFIRVPQVAKAPEDPSQQRK
ncbi:lipocalin family protein [Brevifollis gellanilyticus]|nr:lipocalin family protein [Brevifollis gellanilyticus]